MSDSQLPTCLQCGGRVAELDDVLCVACATRQVDDTGVIGATAQLVCAGIVTVVVFIWDRPAFDRDWLVLVLAVSPAVLFLSAHEVWTKSAAGAHPFIDTVFPMLRIIVRAISWFLVAMIGLYIGAVALQQASGDWTGPVLIVLSLVTFGLWRRTRRLAQTVNEISAQLRTLTMRGGRS